VIKGLGIDIVEIDRIERAVKKNSRFIYRIFTKREILYFSTPKLKYSSVAGNFAAKEAVAKALGMGIRNFSWKDVEIIRDEFGKPQVVLHGKAKDMAIQRDINVILVSISHCRNYAVAEAIAQ